MQFSRELQKMMKMIYFFFLILVNMEKFTRVFILHIIKDLNNLVFVVTNIKLFVSFGTAYPSLNMKILRPEVSLQLWT